MDTMNPDAANIPGPESEADLHRRIGWESVMIAQAKGSIAAGRIVGEAEVDAWIDSIGTDHELPVLYSGR